MTETTKKKRRASPVKARAPKRKLSITEKNLDIKEHIFVIEYVKDWNASQAALRAGYSDNIESARQQGHKLTKKPHIKKAIDEAKQDLIERLKISADRVVIEISKIAFAEPDPDTGIRASDKLKALELLGKNLGLFSEKVEVEHSGKIEGGPDKFEIVIVDAAGQAVTEDGGGETEAEDKQEKG